MRGRLACASITAAVLVVAALAVAAPRPGFTVGYAAGLLSDQFQAFEADLTMAAARTGGLKMLPIADANGKAAKQVADVRKLIAGGAKGIIAVPLGGETIVPALDFAAAKGVPVVAIDTAPDAGRVAMIVRADDRRMAQDACRLIGTAIGGKGTVLSLVGSQATSAGRDRSTGFADCMRKDYPAIMLLEQPTGGQAKQARAAAREIVTTRPDLAAIYMQSDAVMLAGVLAALKSAGRLTRVGAPHHIALVSIDGSPLALQRIRAGYLDAAVSQPLDLYVKYGLRYLRGAVDGQHFSPGPTDHDSRIVTCKGNLMDLLPAPIVTKANAANPELWGNNIKT